jgi:hypothetical protein
LPSIASLQADLGKDGLTVVLVNVGESRESVVRTVEARGYTDRVLLDIGWRATEAYHVQGTPTVYLVGRDGTLLGRAIGPRPWAEPSGRALLSALLRHGLGSAAAEGRGGR